MTLQGEYLYDLIIGPGTRDVDEKALISQQSPSSYGRQSPTPLASVACGVSVGYVLSTDSRAISYSMRIVLANLRPFDEAKGLTHDAGGKDGQTGQEWS